MEIILPAILKPKFGATLKSSINVRPLHWLSATAWHGKAIGYMVLIK